MALYCRLLSLLSLLWLCWLLCCFLSGPLQKNYPMAIKMYRMALDQISSTGKEIRLKIMRNIGNAFVRLGQFQDAIQSYEGIMEGNPGTVRGALV